MQKHRFWSDGSRIESKRLIAAYDKGILVERRQTPAGAFRWLARCEFLGCEQTYDFTDTSSRRTKEARCSNHVSRKNIRGARLFFKEIEIIGDGIRKAFFEGRLIDAKRSGLRAVKWTIKCSFLNCENTLRLGSVQKSSSLFQLCAACNLRRMKGEARKDPIATGLRDRRFVWTDGSWIVGHRIQQAFLEGKLVAKENKIWRARCEHPGCTETYNFSCTSQMQAQQARCPLHTRKFGPPIKARKKVLINGHWTTNQSLAAIAADVVWQDTGSGRFRPKIKCQGRGCTNVVWFNRSKTKFVCTSCVGQSRKIRPFEAIFNLWRRAQIARNKKRKTPLKVCLTYEQFAVFCKNNPNCFFCEKSIGRLPYVPAKSLSGGKGANVRAPYIDRIDPAGHYTLDNIVSACGPCNMSKNIFISQNEMILIGKLRTGRIDEALSQIGKHKTQFLEWGKEVASHSSYWAGARGGRRRKKSGS